MSIHADDFHQQLQACDDTIINPASQPDLLTLALSRRHVLKGGIGCTLLGMLGGSLSACSGSVPGDRKPLLGFTSVPVQTDPRFDRVIVADGYRAQPFFSWGDPVLPDAPPWQADASDDWQAQLQQAGDNHDGMHYFPFPDDPNRHGLLVINHEYINPTLHTDGFITRDGKRPLEQVRKEQAAHGVSIIEIRQDSSGQWQRVGHSRFNRRISALTPMQLSGPLAGHPFMQTASDPRGTAVIGTLNNCSMGFTPWGTYLTCEENWHNYFVNRDKDDHARRPSHWRYGVGNGDSSRYYGWESVDPRFDATPDADQPHGAHVNEPHRFGWVVEIDPFDPDSVPVKRTALGRYCRECAVVSMDEQGRMAIYSGDDTRGEYIYKFVPRQRFSAAQPHAHRDLLDDGTLYVARFNADGSGQWLALQAGQNGLTPENGFADQAFVLLNTRLAADHVGATPMDRPEWVAVHPRTREVYVSCTNNHERGSKLAVDAANPRANNLHGHILRWHEHDANPAATTFTWNLFLLAGESPTNQPNPLTGTIKGDIFSSPDGLAFDASGRLWIETDYDDEEPQNRTMGCNQLLCADPASGEVRRFLVGPRGCEITGITFTPDHRALWINVQHPGISYPASDGKTRPRSTTVLITKEDGGIIGS